MKRIYLLLTLLTVTALVALRIPGQDPLKPAFPGTAYAQGDESDESPSDASDATIESDDDEIPPDPLPDPHEGGGEPNLKGVVWLDNDSNSMFDLGEGIGGVQIFVSGPMNGATLSLSSTNIMASGTWSMDLGETSGEYYINPAQLGYMFDPPYRTVTFDGTLDPEELIEDLDFQAIPDRPRATTELLVAGSLVLAMIVILILAITLRATMINNRAARGSG